MVVTPAIMMFGLIPISLDSAVIVAIYYVLAHSRWFRRFNHWSWACCIDSYRDNDRIWTVVASLASVISWQKPSNFNISF
jgi:hypothetical protein